MIITNAPGGAGGDAVALVNITWPTGSNCVGTCGTTKVSLGTSGSASNVKLTKVGTWTFTCTDGTSSSTDTSVVTVQYAPSVYLAYLVSKAFNACTMSEINDICMTKNAATYVQNGTWTIGDTNNNATYGSYSGIRLVHALTEDQMATYNTTGHIVVESINTLTTSQWAGRYSGASYSGSILFSTLNSTVYNGLNSDFASVLKQFGPPTSQQTNTSSSVATPVEYPLGYLHAPNCVEVGGSNSNRPSENSYSFNFTYYANSGSKAKTGASTTWWLRSPYSYDYLSYRMPSDIWYSYYINADGGFATNSAHTTSGVGVAFIACI